MNLKFHSSVLFVKDIEKSMQFYCDILGQEIDTDFGNNISLKGGLSLWQIPDWHTLKSDFYIKDNTNNALELYFETEDIYQINELINSNNISKHHDLTEESWGQKTIRIYDPDNNLIEIGEKLESFIIRMYEESLSIERINKKSGVPVNLIQEYINNYV
jgi:catechol 2,3-dioxygenase-like lactoylglutathione lyase family enzyme